MKLIVQIPCLNEEQSLAKTLKDIPKRIEGIDQIEILIIDDGSTDGTSKVAQECGAHHIVRLTKRKGLAKVFHIGLDAPGSGRRPVDIRRCACRAGSTALPTLLPRHRDRPITA